MVLIGLFDDQQDLFASGICLIAVCLKAGNTGITAAARVVDIKISILLIIGVECQTKQAHFITTVIHTIGKIEKGL